VAGVGKAMGFAGTAGYIAKLGFPMPEVMTALAIAAEAGGAILLIIGWKTRWVAWGLAIFVVIATLAAHRFWEILFPLNYWDAINAEAGKRQLDPYLVASIIRQESGFEPTTVSNAGAVGIMQIMPAEAPAIAVRAGLPPPTRQQLFDPQTNIAIGAAELAQKLAIEHGNPILAIAAYREALALDPQLADAHFNLARLYDRARNPKASLRHLLAYRRMIDRQGT